MKKHILAATIALSTFGESFSQSTKLPETKQEKELVTIESRSGINNTNIAMYPGMTDGDSPDENSVAVNSLEPENLSEILVESLSSRISFNSVVNKFQTKDFNLSETNYIFIDPETSVKSVANTIKNDVMEDLKYNLFTDGLNISEYNIGTDSYDQVGNNLNWKDAVKVGDLYYGVYNDSNNAEGGSRLEVYDPVTGTKTTLHTINFATEGDFQKIEVDENGNLFLFSWKFLSTFDRNVGFSIFNVTTNSFQTIMFENNDVLDYTGIAGIGVANGKYYFGGNYVKDGEVDKIRVYEINLSDGTYSLVYEKDQFLVGDDSMSDFIAYANYDNLTRFGIQLPNAQKTLIVKESVAPFINTPISDEALDEDFDEMNIDLSNLTADPTDVITIGSMSPAGVVGASIVSGVDGYELMFTAIADANGSVTITLDATNTVGQTTTGIDTVEVTVNAINDAPTLTSTITAFATEDEAYTYNITGEDVDRDALIFTTSSLPSWLSFDGTDAISGTPTNDEVGEYLFSISINDGIIVTDTDVALIVENVNDAPTLTSATTVSATEDEAFSYTIIGNDIDGDALTFAVSNLPSWLSFDNTDQITGTPSNDEVGEHILSVSIQDGTVSVDTDITLTVENVNDAPTLTSSSTVSATEDIAYTYTIIGNDVDGDALTFAVSNLPSWLSFDNTDKITGTPSNDEVGEHILNVSIQDGTVSVDTDITLTVENVNDAPEVSEISNQNIDAGKQLVGVLFTITDVDNEISLSGITTASSNQALVADSDIAIIALADNQYEVQLLASEGVSGELSIDVSVSDGELSTTASFDIFVNLVLSIEDKSTRSSLTLFPNPVTDMLSMDYATSSDYQYSIYSIEGQLMFQDYIQKSNSQLSIDVSAYPKGMYIMQIDSSIGNNVVRKFIKK